jgi:hypothetical protein
MCVKESHQFSLAWSELVICASFIPRLVIFFTVLSEILATCVLWWFKILEKKTIQKFRILPQMLVYGHNPCYRELQDRQYQPANRKLTRNYDSLNNNTSAIQVYPTPSYIIKSQAPEGQSGMSLTCKGDSLGVKTSMGNGVFRWGVPRVFVPVHHWIHWCQVSHDSHLFSHLLLIVYYGGVF